MITTTADHKTKRPKSPLIYFGGKQRLRHVIVPLIDAYPHRIYVEPFGGGASILLGKTPSPVEVFNDLDRDLVTFFKVIADPGTFEDFCRRVAPLPYSRALFLEARDTYDDETQPVLRAVKWFIMARQSFSGSIARRAWPSWGHTISETRQTMAKRVHDWLAAVDRLPDIHHRLQRVQIECCDFRSILDRYDTPETLFYCDPPYVLATRTGSRYKHEMTDEDHRDLVAALTQLQGAAILSGYRNDIYTPLEDQGWLTRDHRTNCYAVARTRQTGVLGKGAAARHTRTETLWIHPKLRPYLEALT